MNCNCEKNQNSNRARAVNVARTTITISSTDVGIEIETLVDCNTPTVVRFDGMKKVEIYVHEKGEAIGSMRGSHPFMGCFYRDYVVHDVFAIVGTLVVVLERI